MHRRCIRCGTKFRPRFGGGGGRAKAEPTGDLRLGLCWQFSAQPMRFRTATSTALARWPRREQLSRLAALGVAIVAATQSTTSLIPALGADQAKVFTLNLRNRLIFTAADEDDAKASAEFLGKVIKRERSVTRGQGEWR